MRGHIPVLLLPLLLASCFGNSTASPTTAREQAPEPSEVAAVKRVCPLTLPNGQRPRDNASGMNHGDGRLWTAMWPYDLVVASPDNVGKDGAIEMKWPWFRGVPGQVRISGHRLDGSAGRLTADVSKGGFGSLGFQPSTIRFPSPGCWEVTAAVGSERLTFVTLVVKASDYAALTR